MGSSNEDANDTNYPSSDHSVVCVRRLPRIVPRLIESYLPTLATIPLEVTRELMMRAGMMARAASKPAVEISIRTHGVVPNKARVHTIKKAAVHNSVHKVFFCVLI